jgi:CBS domain-containing protein
MQARDIMTTDVITVKPGMDIHAFAKLLIDKNISGAPVVDESGKYMGVVLEESLIIKDKKIHLPTFILFLSGFFTIGEKRFEDELLKISASTISGIMDIKAPVIPPDTPVEDIATNMIENNIHYFPVVEKSKVIGVVTKKDVVRSIAKE